MKSIILNATSEFRHQNIMMYSMRNAYLFQDLLNISFNSVIKLLAFLKINFKWALNGKCNLNIKREMRMNNII